LNEQLTNNLNLVIQYVRGRVSEDIMDIVDILIDEGDISQEWFDANELEFLTAVDKLFFECENLLDCSY
jgi:hypothetical protein